MYIAVEGCCHGELEQIYDSLLLIQSKHSIMIDLLLICGDFEAVRNMTDLCSMACPEKYRHMTSYHKYYSGQKEAPILTVFVGGNHEAALHMFELPHGGWVAKNIYFLGTAGVVNFRGVRIGGISGIYDPMHFKMGHFERPPFSDSQLRSFYHTREFDVLQLMELEEHMDIFLSHDWPIGVARFGDWQTLFEKKPYWIEELEKDELGSPALKNILNKLQPDFWFSAHMHIKFPALVTFPNSKNVTRFLALDKCLPNRDFIQVLEVAHKNDDYSLKYDLEWMSIVKANYFQTPVGINYPPLKMVYPSVESKEKIRESLSNHSFSIPNNFVLTVEPHASPVAIEIEPGPYSQTTAFLSLLEIEENRFYPGWKRSKSTEYVQGLVLGSKK